MDLLCFFCPVFAMCLLCLCKRLFICALWSPAGKGLTSWLSFVVSNSKNSEFEQEIPQSQTADNPMEEPLNHHETPGRQIK